MKKSVDLKALYIAIKDGRIDVWLNGNGQVCIMNNRTKRTVVATSMHDMEYDPYVCATLDSVEQRYVAII